MVLAVAKLLTPYCLSRLRSKCNDVAGGTTARPSCATAIFDQHFVPRSSILDLDRSSLSSMALEISAHWCARNGIPIPLYCRRIRASNLASARTQCGNPQGVVQQESASVCNMRLPGCPKSYMALYAQCWFANDLILVDMAVANDSETSS